MKRTMDKAMIGEVLGMRTSADMREAIKRAVERGEPLGAFHNANATIKPNVFAVGTLMSKEQMQNMYSKGPKRED